MRVVQCRVLASIGVELGPPVETMNATLSGKTERTFLAALALLTWILVAEAQVSANAAAQPGSLDATFRPDVAGNPWDLSATYQAVAVDAQLRVWLGTTGGQLLRLLPDGHRDGGFRPTNFLATSIWAILPMADGGAFVGGTTIFVPGGIQQRALLRLRANGSVDRTFEALDSEALRVLGLALHPEGGLLVVGDLGRWGGLRLPGIARLNLDGSVEPGFTGNLPPIDANFFPVLDRVAVLPSGQVLAGSKPFLRLSAEGRMQSKFTLPTATAASTVGPDGSVWFVTVEGVEAGLERLRVQRHKEDGQLDPGWGRLYACEGKVTVMTVQPDGKPILGGKFSVFGGGRHQSLVRLNTDGTVDHGFVSEVGGLPQAGPADPSSQEAALVSGLVQLPDDKLLVHGIFLDVGTTRVGSLARLQASQRAPAEPVIRGASASLKQFEGGRALLTFALESALPVQGSWFHDGVPVPSAGLSAPEAPGVLVLDDLRMRDAGDYQLKVTNSLGVEVSSVIRLSVEMASAELGTLDVPFRASALQPAGSGTGASLGVGAAAYTADGQRIYVWHGGVEFAGASGQGTRDVARLYPDGGVDHGFVMWRDAARLELTDFLPLRDGRGLAAVISVVPITSNPLASPGLVRVTADGSLDPTFRWELEAATHSSRITDMLELPDGRLLVAGAFKSGVGTPPWNLVRLLADGQVDPTFHPVTSLDWPHLLRLQSKGQVIAVGSRAGGGNAVHRFLADGSPDPSFTVFTPRNGIRCLLLDACDRILIGSETLFAFSDPFHPTFSTVLLRLRSDGTYDTSFRALDGTNDQRPFWVQDLALQADGRILVQFGDDFSTYRRLMRLDPNGGDDSSFQGPTTDGEVLRVLVTPDSQILIAGDFGVVGGAFRPALARLNLMNDRRLRWGRNAAEGGRFVGSLPTRLGRQYIVEGTESVRGAPWKTFKVLNGDGHIQSIDPSASPAQFYRIRINEPPTP